MQPSLALQDESDESLMLLIQTGSHQAFSVLVRRHTSRFFATAYNLSGNASEAEDLVQEAFLKIWHRPSIWKNDKGAKFTTWFYRILVNMNIDELRKKKRMTGDQALEFMADKSDSPEQQVALNEEQIMIERALESLPERQRTALNLCFYEGASNAQAAEIMGVKVKALESLLMRAKAGLKEFFAHNENKREEGERYGTR
jgi:RNA polymerase sigma-70 factor (ECF subfamily)